MEWLKLHLHCFYPYGKWKTNLDYLMKYNKEKNKYINLVWEIVARKKPAKCSFGIKMGALMLHEKKTFCSKREF